MSYNNNQTIQTLSEIENCYADQWVLVQLTDFDKHGNPIKGIVMAHSPERESLIQPRKQLHRQNSGVKTYTFYTGIKVPENVIVIL